MSETLVVEVKTQVFGLGSGRPALPTLVALQERTLPARTLIAAHVRAEVAEAKQRRTSSLALHYMLSSDVRKEPVPLSSSPNLDCAAEIKRAWQGVVERRYLLVVDGIAVDDLDAVLTLTDHSSINFVRLLPLVGG